MIYTTVNDLVSLVKKLKSEGKTIVLSTGFFDLLHTEHKKFIQAAKLEADVLIIGIESDKRARSVKGKGRPFEDQKTRAKKVEDAGADHVLLLPDNFDNPTTRRELIRKLAPNIFAVSEGSPHQKLKNDTVNKFGGALKVVLEHNSKISTTKIASRGKKV